MAIQFYINSMFKCLVCVLYPSINIKLNKRMFDYANDTFNLVFIDKPFRIKI